MNTLSYANDIQPMFREKDVAKMIDIAGFDLSKYEDVKEWAEGICSRLEHGSMPCDGVWPEEKLNKFKRWIDQGMEP